MIKARLALAGLAFDQIDEFKKNKMKAWLPVVLVFVLSSSFLLDFPNSIDHDIKLVVDRNSSMSIKGSSNVNEFICDVRQYLEIDTLSFVRDSKSQRLFFTKSEIQIEVKKFDCHNRFITQDFYKTLKSDSFPFLRIRLLSLDQNLLNKNSQLAKGIVEIQLANKLRKMEVDLVLLSKGSGRFQLIGSQKMNFSDFALVPPRKIAGLIKINEEITVNFELFLHSI